MLDDLAITDDGFVALKWATEAAESQRKDAENLL